MPKSRETLNSIYQLWQKQERKCANPSCQAIIPPFGYHRAVHRNVHGRALAILCKPCWTGLALLKFDRKRVLGVALYLRRLKKK